MTPTSRLSLTALGSLFLAAGAFALPYGAYFFTLGHLVPGSSRTDAQGMTPDGGVVVGSSSAGTASAPGNFHAVQWSGGNLTGLPELPGATASTAIAISANGKIIVGTVRYGEKSEPYRWTSAGMVGLGDTVYGTGKASATGISSNGFVIIGNAPRSFGEQDAFYWTSSNGFKTLGDLPGGGYLTSATGVSANGSVIVGSVYSAEGRQAFRWTKETGIVGIGDLPGGLYQGAATSVSEDGRVIVGYGATPNGNEAFRWTSEGGMVGLGDLPGGPIGSLAQATSADGQVVVGRSSVANDAHGSVVLGFLWDARRGMVKVQDLMVAAGLGSSLNGWRIVELKAVSITPEGIAIVSGDATRRNASGVLESDGFVASFPLYSTFNPLGDLPGGAFASVSRSLSPDGSAVVGVADSSTGRRAFMWKGMTGMIDIGAGGIDATGVSNYGTIMVGQATNNRAYRWIYSGVSFFTGNTPFVTGTSAPGTAHVGSAIGSDGRRHAYRWTSNTTAQYATYVGTHIAPSVGTAISADGTAFAGTALPHTHAGVNYASRAFLYTSNGGQRPLGDLPGGTVESESLGISGDGATVVGWSRSINGPEAFRWTAAGGMVGLGDLPGGAFASRATAATQDGKVIVGFGVAPGGNRAFIWDSVYGIRELQPLIAAHALGTPLAGWTLTSASSVTRSYDGAIVVAGTGIDPLGRQQAFRATLPESVLKAPVVLP